MFIVHVQSLGQELALEHGGLNVLRHLGLLHPLFHVYDVQDVGFHEHVEDLARVLTRPSEQGDLCRVLGSGGICKCCTHINLGVRGVHMFTCSNMKSHYKRISKEKNLEGKNG